MQDNSPYTFTRPQPLKTAVLFLVFNRLDTTKHVFEAIRLARPSRLYIAADGPRDSRSSEDKKIKAVRDYVMGHIDWACEVKTLFREKNLGCKYAVSGGIDWFFENEEMGIILEDDCLPHPSFFSFCEELLERYREDERVMNINGSNYQFGCKYGEASYYFSRYPHIWGWASWRRAWQHYDVDIKEWNSSNNKNKLLRVFSCRAERRFWKMMWNKVEVGKIDTWDFQWAFACLVRRSLSIAPNVNLISNIGFGSDSTHTTSAAIEADMPTVAMEFPLVHPRSFVRNADADEHESKLFLRMPSYIRRVAGRIKCIFFN